MKRVMPDDKWDKRGTCFSANDERYVYEKIFWMRSLDIDNIQDSTRLDELIDAIESIRQQLKSYEIP